MMTASISFFSRLVQTSTAILYTISEFNVIQPVAFFLFFQRHVYPDCGIFTGEEANRNLLQNPLAVILRIRFGSAVHKTVFLTANYLRAKVHIVTHFLNCYVYSIRCIDRHIELTEGKIPLLGSVTNNPAVKRLEYVEDDNSELTTDTPTKNMD